MGRSESRRGRRNHSSKFLCAAVAGTFAAVALPSLAGAATSYNDSVTGRFNAAGTWLPAGGPPVTGDSATIDNRTVNTLSAGEVASGVTVNVSGTGVFQLSATGSTQFEPILSGATVNVLTGGTMQIDNWNTVNIGNLVLDGGTLKPTHYNVRVYGSMTVSSASTINIVSYPTISTVAHGNGKLTITGTNIDSRTGFGFEATSDWGGDLDFAGTGTLRGSGATGHATYLAKTIPSNLRLGAGAIFSNLNYNVTGWAGLPGLVTGNGTLTGYHTIQWDVGATGTLSPGDVGISGGVGNLKVAAVDTGNYDATLKLRANSTLAVDITGASTYDQATVSGKGTGVGHIIIDNGAKLLVNLWTPSVETTLDATIIDASGTQTGSAFTGVGSTITWNNSAGWTNLSTSWVGPDLHVTGTFNVPEPSSAMGLLGAGALMAIRRRRRV